MKMWNCKCFISKRIVTSLSITIIIIVIIVSYLYHITNPSHRFHPDLSDNNLFIAHATGSLEGYTYLNSKESLMASLENGYKYIEVDLQFTSDSVLVCVHDWEQFNKMTIPNISRKDSNLYMKVPSFKEFKSRKIYKKYTPMSFSDVIEIRKKNPFIIVTDRISDAETLNQFFEVSERRNVMVEAFSNENYLTLKKEGYTPLYSMGSFSLFKGGIQIIYSQLFRDGYEWIVADQHCSKRTLRLLKKLFGIKFALSTVNSDVFFDWHLVNDIDLVYTDNWNLKTQLNNFQNKETQ